MKAVIDTNCLVSSISPRSPHYWLYQAFKSESFEWVVSNEILIEYEEIISSRYSPKAANLVLSIIMVAPNVIFQSPYYRWQLIQNEPEDNKFVDAYVSAGADYLVTQDSDFNILKSIEFPSIKVLTLMEFREIIFSR